MARVLYVYTVYSFFSCLASFSFSLSSFIEMKIGFLENGHSQENKTFFQNGLGIKINPSGNTVYYVYICKGALRHWVLLYRVSEADIINWAGMHADPQEEEVEEDIRCALCHLLYGRWRTTAFATPDLRPWKKVKAGCIYNTITYTHKTCRKENSLREPLSLGQAIVRGLAT